MRSRAWRGIQLESCFRSRKGEVRTKFGNAEISVASATDAPESPAAFEGCRRSWRSELARRKSRRQLCRNFRRRLDAPELSALASTSRGRGAGNSGGPAMRPSSASASAPEIPAGISMHRGSWRRLTAENLGDCRPCAGMVTAHSRREFQQNVDARELSAPGIPAGDLDALELLTARRCRRFRRAQPSVCGSSNMVRSRSTRSSQSGSTM